MATKQKNKLFLISVLSFIFFVLLLALVIEYGLNHQPCKLCIYERVPYFLSALLIIKILLFNKNEKITLLIISLIFFISCLLSFYHFGIEQGFFRESFACTTADIEKTLTEEDLLKELKNNKIISCKDVSFRILGLSLATINIIFSLGLSVIFAKLFKDYGKNK